MTDAPLHPTAAARKAHERKMRGYVISEDNDLVLKEVALAMDAVAMLCDPDGTGEGLPEMDGQRWAALFSVFSRQISAIHDDAAFANEAFARPRSVN